MAATRASERRGRSAVGIGDAAWIGALAAVPPLLAAIVVAGPWLGRTFLASGGDPYWAMQVFPVRPEPEELGRVLVALLGPALAVGALTLLHRSVRLPQHVTAVAVRVAQGALLAALVVAVVAQRTHTYSEIYSGIPFTRAYFTLPTLLVAALATAALALTAGRVPATSVARLTRETRPRAIACALVAVAATIAWLSSAVLLDASAANTSEGVIGDTFSSLNETFSVLNGSGPLTGFHAQYGQLWPYLVAGVMSLLGPSLGVYSITMAAINLLALTTVYAILRRFARGPLLALALYLPFVSTSFFVKLGPLSDRYAPSTLFSLWPVRYAGPYLLAWLLVRHLDGRAPRRRVLLLAGAGLVAVNNPEFGLPAFAATLAALLLARPPRDWRPLARLSVDATAGLAVAAAAVAALTLAVVGELPRPLQLFEFSRIYGAGGWAMLPMPALGLHLALYVTAAAAIVVATARALAGARDATLTAALGWSGVFGLLTGAYFAGRSHPEVLIDLFSAWAFAIVLLLVVVARSVAARPSRRPTAIELTVVFCFCVMACSLPQVPTPWSQAQRIGDVADTRPVEQPAAVRFVQSVAEPDERVLILMPLGHRIAQRAGVENVSPYTSIESMPMPRQLDTALEQLRDSGGERVFVSLSYTPPEVLDALEAAGLRAVRYDEGNGFVALADAAGSAGTGAPAARSSAASTLPTR